MVKTELVDQVYEILCSIAHFRKYVSPGIWPIVDACCHTFKSEKMVKITFQVRLELVCKRLREDNFLFYFYS